MTHALEGLAWWSLFCTRWHVLEKVQEELDWVLQSCHFMTRLATAWLCCAATTAGYSAQLQAARNHAKQLTVPRARQHRWCQCRQ
jgi:hypothetical protein